MLLIVSLILSVIIPVIIYGYIRKKDACGEKLPARKYVYGAIWGMTGATILIMILELTWDRFFMPDGAKTMWDEISTSFFRAALLEEAAKMLFAVRSIKKSGVTRRYEYMLMAGTVGLGYAFIEKLVLGNPMALIIKVFLPFHMLFQFLMGEYLYRASRDGDDAGARRSDLIKAFVLPFLAHGTWDSLIGVSGKLLDMDDVPVLTYVGLAGMIGFVIAGFIAEIKIIKKVAKIAADEINTETGEPDGNA